MTENGGKSNLDQLEIFKRDEGKGRNDEERVVKICVSLSFFSTVE